MYTSIALAVLLSPGAAAPQLLTSETPSWQTDYTAAYKASREQNKPLAVFIGSGAKGWEKVSQENKLSDVAQRTLGEGYVCVYADAASPVGKRKARSSKQSGNRSNHHPVHGQSSLPGVHELQRGPAPFPSVFLKDAIRR